MSLNGWRGACRGSDVDMLTGKIGISVIFSARAIALCRGELFFGCCSFRACASEAIMVWYIAITALLNLGLGYFLAVYFGASRPQVAVAAGDAFDDEEFADSDLEA